MAVERHTSNRFWKKSGKAVYDFLLMITGNSDRNSHVSEILLWLRVNAEIAILP